MYHNISLVSNGGGSVAFVAKNSDTTLWHELLHQLGPFCTGFCNTTKRSQMHQNSMKRYETWVLGPMGWIGCLTRLRGMNFCTTSARFVPSFVRQPNSTKCTQILQNAPKHEFRFERVQSGAFVAKNSVTTSWHDLLHQFDSFCTEFCKATKRSLMHPNRKNTPKYEFLSQRGQSGVFVVKNYDVTSWHVLLHQFGPFCTEFCKAAKRSQMHPNSPRHTKIWV